MSSLIFLRKFCLVTLPLVLAVLIIFRQVQYIIKKEEPEAPLAFLELNSKEIKTRLSQLGFEARQELARRFRELAIAEMVTSSERQEIQLKLLCLSLSAAGAALELEPYASRSLLSWAGSRQLLGEYDCNQSIDGLPYNQGDYRDVVSFVVNIEPSNPQLLFAGGIIYNLDNQLQLAAPLFRKAVDISTEFGFSQEQYLISLLEAGALPEKILPPNLIQLTKWSRQIEGFYGAGLVRAEPPFKASLERLQIEALNRAIDQVSDKKMERDVLYQSALKLSSYEGGDEFRKLLDKFLSKEAKKRGEEALSLFFSRRSELRSAEFILASLRKDTRPLRSQFFNWGSSKEVTFDEHGESVGIFLSSHTPIKRIEVASDAVGANLSSSNIRVYFSQDNIKWEEASAYLKWEFISLAGKPIFAISLNQAYLQETKLSHSFSSIEKARLWKINYSGITREGNFAARLDRMVKGFY
jgi:hypothetical protein